MQLLKIKYRAKTKNSSRWVYGYYVYKQISDKHFIVMEEVVPYSITTILTETEVLPETVQQLHHKWWRGDHYRNCNIPFAVFDKNTDFNAWAKWFRGEV